MHTSYSGLHTKSLIFPKKEMSPVNSNSLILHLTLVCVSLFVAVRGVEADYVEGRLPLWGGAG